MPRDEDNRFDANDDEGSADSLFEHYTVVEGDTLWSIAETALGDGKRYREIWDLNRDKAMLDGRSFLDPNLIFPGWVLRLPAALPRVESELGRYLHGSMFRTRHPLSYKRLAQAETKLWPPSAENELTEIGHLCREAVREFAHELAQSRGIKVESKELTINVVKSVIQQVGAGRAISSLLSALVAYWSALNQLIQRQEHGGVKEGEELTWEDARRVVFQTAVVMYELDRALAQRTE